MSIAVILPTYRSGSAGEQTWDDLRVCLASVAAYGRGIEVVVAWDGPCPPDDLPRNPRSRVLHRPSGMTSSRATFWAFDQTDATDFVLLSDDVVLAPDSLRLLFEDAKTLCERGHRIGVLACRSNVAPGPQNVRSANGGTLRGGLARYDSEDTVFQARRVSPFCAFTTRTACQAITVPDVEWYNDDIGCYDLMRAGYTNWVSRSYVHHVGMRSSIGPDSDRLAVMRQMNDESLAWIRANRPDFWEYLQTGNIAPATTAAPDRELAHGPAATVRA